MSDAIAECAPDVADALTRLCTEAQDQEPISEQRRAEVRAALEECKRAAVTGERMDQAKLVALIDMLPEYYKKTLLLVLSQRNSRVVEYNSVTTAVFGCNTAIYFLSSGAAARIAVFYLLGMQSHMASMFHVDCFLILCVRSIPVCINPQRT